MADDRYAERAARVLIAARAGLTQPDDADPAATIRYLQVALATSVRRRRRRIVLTSVAASIAAAAALIAMLGRATQNAELSFVVENSGSGWLVRDSRLQPALRNQTLLAGDTVRTIDASTSLRSSDGTRVVVGPESDLTVVQAGATRWVRLTRGGVRLEVAKLESAQRFLVETPDREVEVKGTRFEVRLGKPDECGTGTVTRVAVEEGTVNVRTRSGAGELVRAGDRWPTGCSSASGDLSAGGMPPPAPSTSLPTSRLAQPVRARARRDIVGSTLAAENDLFSAAIRAEKAGDREAALRLLDELTQRYPASPLREAATAEYLKLSGATVRSSDPGRP